MGRASRRAPIKCQKGAGAFIPAVTFCVEKIDSTKKEIAVNTGTTAEKTS